MILFSWWYGAEGLFSYRIELHGEGGLAIGEGEAEGRCGGDEEEDGEVEGGYHVRI